MNLAYQIFIFSRDERFKKTEPLQIASSLGLTALTEKLLSHGTNINAQGGRYGNALQAAAEGGHEAVVGLLSAHPALIITKPILMAIVARAKRGKEDMEVLLSVRPDIEITECSSPVTEDVPPRRDRSIHGVPPSVTGLVLSRSVPLHPTSVYTR